MSLFQNIRSAFVFSKLFGTIITGFGGSNIVVAVLQIALQIRQWFEDGKPTDQVDDIAQGIYDGTPQEVKDRYDGKGYFKEGILRLIEAMHLFHLGKEHLKAHNN